MTDCFRNDGYLHIKFVDIVDYNIRVDIPVPLCPFVCERVTVYAVQKNSYPGTACFRFRQGWACRFFHRV